MVLVYPVRGHGRDTGEMTPNCYFPYTNLLPFVDKLHAAIGAPVMALPMHWEGTAPWAPPFVWPPFGGEENFFAFRDALHAGGESAGRLLFRDRVDLFQHAAAGIRSRMHPGTGKDDAPGAQGRT